MDLNLMPDTPPAAWTTPPEGTFFLGPASDIVVHEMKKVLDFK